MNILFRKVFSVQHQIGEIETFEESSIGNFLFYFEVGRLSFRIHKTYKSARNLVICEITSRFELKNLVFPFIQLNDFLSNVFIYLFFLLCLAIVIKFLIQQSNNNTYKRNIETLN